MCIYKQKKCCHKSDFSVPLFTDQWPIFLTARDAQQGGPILLDD
jgi:hypothetical protein